MTLHDWQAYSKASGNPNACVTVVAVSGDPDWAAASTQTNTVASLPDAGANLRV